MAKYRWRCTDLIAANGGPVADDCCLYDAAGQPVTRIYKVRGEPYDGHWFYALQVDEHGRPWNAGTGYCASGREAKQICEAMAAKVSFVSYRRCDSGRPGGRPQTQEQRR